MSLLRQTDFLIRVSLGLEPGFQTEYKFGSAPSNRAGIEDVWDGANGTNLAYTYPFASSAGTWTCSSSNSGDTTQVTWGVITEDGSGNWNYENVAVTLQGTTQVNLSPTSGDSIIRANRGWNSGAAAFAGDVYLYESDTTASVAGVPDNVTTTGKAIILNGEEQTLQCVYTIPDSMPSVKGMPAISSVSEALLLQYRAGIVTSNKNGNDAIFALRAREDGGVFRTQDKTGAGSLGELLMTHDFRGGQRFIPKTDIVLRKVSSDVSFSTNGRFDFLLCGTP